MEEGGIDASKASWEIAGKLCQVSKVLGCRAAGVWLTPPTWAEADIKIKASAVGLDLARVLKESCPPGLLVEAELAHRLACLAQKYRPDIILLPGSDWGREVAALAAAWLETGLTADCTELRINEQGLLEQVRPALSGNVLATIICPRHRPQMATVRPHVFPLPPGLVQPSARAVSSELIEESVFSLPGYRGHAALLSKQQVQSKPPTFADKQLPHTRFPLEPEVEHLDQNDIDAGYDGTLPTGYDTIPPFPVIMEESAAADSGLDSASVIVAGGRGIGGSEGFEVLRQLACELGGVVAGSRPAVQAGWVERERQVGQTGKTVRPRLYIAVGISGAVQHLVGMQGARRVMAVNQDPDAPIMAYADLAIVGDWREVLPELISQLKADGQEDMP